MLIKNGYPISFTIAIFFVSTWRIYGFENLQCNIVAQLFAKKKISYIYFALNLQDFFPCKTQCVIFAWSLMFHVFLGHVGAETFLKYS